MRQSDGAELLGPNDPRSASIGVIYVDANDNRQSVLTAILTQDKFGREEVVVVLPENNRAFQRPVDFDGLRNMRRGLKSEIVFIAPSGPGPAQFARQRRFPVYSSPENFVQSLKIEAAANEAGKKRGFLLRRKPKPAGASTTSSTAKGRIEQKPASPLPVNLPMPGPGEDEDITNVSAGPAAAVAGMAGAAAGFGSGALLDEQGASSTPENSDAGSPIYESTPASSAAVQSNPAGPNEADRPEDPGIIRFPPPAPRRPRTTDKLAVPPSEPAPVPLVAPVAPAQPQIPAAASTTRRGKAVAAGGAAAGAGAVSAVRTANGGGTPPTGSGTGGPGGGSGGPGRSPRRTRRWLAILLVVLTLMLIAAIAIASNILPGAVTTATVTITPISHPLSDNFIITAVTGTPHPADRQVQARILSATSVTGQSTVTSSGNIPGAPATGQLFFLNTTSSAITFSSVTLRGASGVPVSFNGPVMVPAIPPSITVQGFAVDAGAAGNIGALDINGPCCGAKGITVKNGAFSGGQNPQAHAVVEQTDIDAATNNLITMLKPGVLKDLRGQVRSNEAVVPNTLQCPSKSNLTRDHNAGAQAGSVTVSGTITCTEEVYDQQAALTMAANLLTAEALKDFGPNFALTGNIVKGVTQVTQGSGGNVNVEVSAAGVWVYNKFDIPKLKKDIAGMSKQDAINFLLNPLKQPGVGSVTIVIFNGNTTLPDAAHITININSVPGASGTPTITPGSPTVVPTPTTPPITPTQGLGG